MVCHNRGELCDPKLIQHDQSLSLLVPDIEPGIYPGFSNFHTPKTMILYCCPVFRTPNIKFTGIPAAKASSWTNNGQPYCQSRSDRGS